MGEIVISHADSHIEAAMTGRALNERVVRACSAVSTEKGAAVLFAFPFLFDPSEPMPDFAPMIALLRESVGPGVVLADGVFDAVGLTSLTVSKVRSVLDGMTATGAPGAALERQAVGSQGAPAGLEWRPLVVLGVAKTNQPLEGGVDFMALIGWSDTVEAAVCGSMGEGSTGMLMATSPVPYPFVAGAFNAMLSHAAASADTRRNPDDVRTAVAGLVDGAKAKGERLVARVLEAPGAAGPMGNASSMQLLVEKPDGEAVGAWGLFAKDIAEAGKRVVDLLEGVDIELVIGRRRGQSLN